MHETHEAERYHYMKSATITLREEELLRRLNWLLQLRWLAIIGLLSTLFIIPLLFDLVLPKVEILCTVFILIIYNIIFVLWRNNLAAKEPTTAISSARKHANLQIIIDCIILTYLIHITGGVENPLVFFAVFHVVIASILRRWKKALILTVFEILLLNSLFWLEYFIPGIHRHLEGFLTICLAHNLFYIFAISLTLTTTLLLTCFMATSITTQLRTREDQLAELKESLENANKQLEDLIESRTRFMRMVEHEMRSPLAAIQSCLNVILSGLTDQASEKTIEMVERANTRAKALQILSHDLLEFSRLERQKQEGTTEPEQIDFVEVLKNGIEFYTPLGEERKIQINRNLPENPVFLKADRRDLEQVVNNLLSNAIKYSHDEKSIDITLLVKTNSMALSVKDRGIGISEKDQKKLFTEFFRAENAKNTGKEGTGLGLTIVKLSVEKYGGNIKINSSENAGTEVIVTIPALP